MKTDINLKPEKYIKTVSRAHEIEVLIPQFEDRRIFKAYCKTHRKNLNSDYVTWDVLQETIVTHCAAHPKHTVSFKELIEN